MVPPEKRGKGIYAILTSLDEASPGGERISPKAKMMIVAATAVIALIVVVVGLASLVPKSKPQSVNELPVATFTYDANNLTVMFDATASSDPDGSIANYSWTFGDASEGNGKIVTHVYANDGAFKANLTVTDNGGGKNSTSKELTVKMTVNPAKKYPVAVIQMDKDGLRVNVSGEKSHAEDDATITSYAWTFGDGGSATGVTATHTYAANGTYTINLTVTDSNGLTNSTTISATVASLPTPPPPPPPPPPTKDGPPGLLHAIEIHKEKAGRNSGLQNSLDHLQGNLQKWLDSHTNEPTA